MPAGESKTVVDLELIERERCFEWHHIPAKNVDVELYDVLRWVFMMQGSWCCYIAHADMEISLVWVN
ncbi:hypothetical protein OAE80_04615 [Planctomycetaceae bacterium]|nr:hypothetical protein [Planctomycetaceae bacterium]